MNFNDYKAKYAKNATAAATAVETTATKIDNAVKKGALKTKDAATTTGSALMGTLPVTTRKHNAFAAKVSADLNGLNRRVDRHDLLLDVLAEGTGLVLPSNEVLDQYLDEQAAERQAPAQEEVIAGVVAKVLASLGLSTAPVVESVLSPEVTAELNRQQAEAPTVAEEEASAKADAELKKEQRRLAAIAKKAKEVVKKEELPEEDFQAQDINEYLEVEAPIKEEKPVKKIKRQRKKGGMGRQEPLAAE